MSQQVIKESSKTKNEVIKVSRAWNVAFASKILVELADFLKNIIYYFIFGKYWAGWSTNWNEDCWEKYQ